MKVGDELQERANFGEERRSESRTGAVAKKEETMLAARANVRSRARSQKGPKPRHRVAGQWVLVVAVLLALGHLLFWYWPRERSARPQVDDAPYRLLGDDGYRWRLWLPYPHQNLGALEKNLKLEAVPALWGSELPRFGFFRLPPSRELTIAWNPADRESEESLAAVARVYPLLAGISRIAGRLASNPWLSGGPVRLGERVGEVWWQGTLWTFRTGRQSSSLQSSGGRPSRSDRFQEISRDDRSPGLLSAQSTEFQPAESQPARSVVPVLLAGFGSNLESGFVGPGSYGLRRSRQRWRLDRLPIDHSASWETDSVSWDSSAVALWLEQQGLGGAELAQRKLSLLAVRSHGPSDSEPTAPSFELLGLLGPRADHKQAARAGTLRLPSGFSLSLGSASRWRLPAERLYRRLGVGLFEQEGAGWRLMATDERALAVGRRLVPEEPLGFLGGSAGARARSSCFWVDPGSTRLLAEDLVVALSGSPLARPSDWQDWHVLSLVAAAVEELGWVWLEASEVGLDLRFEAAFD